MKKRLISLALVLTMVLALFTVGAFAANDDSMEDLHVSKELVGPNSSGEYTLKLSSYATGEVKQTEVQEAVPTDFVLVLDQSGSMEKKDIPTGYRPAGNSWAPQDFLSVRVNNSGDNGNSIDVNHHTYYYRVPGTDEYYEVYYKDFPSNSFTRLPENEGALDYTTYESITDWFGQTYEYGNCDSRYSGYYEPVYYKAADGAYYRVYTYSKGLLLRYHLTLFYYDKTGSRVDLGTYTYAWLSVANNRVTVPLYTNEPYSRTRVYDGWWDPIGHYEYSQSHINHGYKPYYTDGNGVEHQLPGSLSVNGEGDTFYSDVLYEKTDDITRVSALENAVTNFVDLVHRQASDNNVNHKVAVVGFSDKDGSSDNTELLSTGSLSTRNGSYYNYDHKLFPYGVNYNGPEHDGSSTVGSAGGISTENYQAALQDASTDSGVAVLKQAAKAVTACGGTEPEYGFYMAENILKNRTEKTYQSASGTQNRATVIVYFTDGHPGNYDSSDQIDAANKVVTAANRLKTNAEYNSKVYSIGVFSEGDDQPLTYTTGTSSSYDGADNYLTTDGDYFYFRGNKTSETNHNDTIGDYMRCVSSEYQSATNFLNSDYKTSNGTSGTGRGTKAEETYYMRVTDAAGLERAFEKAMSEVESIDVTIPLNEESVLKDFISDNVKLPQGFGTDNVSAYYVPCNGKTGNEFTFNENDKHSISSDHITVQGNMVSVDGFNYTSSQNIVAQSGNTYRGNKLVVEISGLKPLNDKRLTDENTNADDSGIYLRPSDTAPVKEFETCYFPANAFAIAEEKVEDDGTITPPTELKLYEYAGHNPFNVTSSVSDGYLYGGIYTDDTLQSFVTTTPGTEWPTEIGKTYYVKSVSNVYLQPRSVKLYFGKNEDGTKKIISTYGMTVTDDNTYREVGLLYNGNKKKSKDDKLYSSVTFKNVNEDSPYTPASILASGNLVNGTATETACLAVALLDVQATGTVQPYWVTPDGVRVTGDVLRNMKNGSKYGSDVPHSALKPVKDTESTYKENGMTVQSLFVGVEDEEEPADSGIKLAGYTTSLNGNIAMNFYMDLSDEVAADKDAYMQFTLPGANHTEEVVKLADAKKQVRGGKTYYVFSAGVAAKDMTSEIKAQFVKGDGTASEEWSYTIKEYCDYVRNHPDSYDAESVALVEAMLNYGGYTQEYFKHNTDKLANADLDLALPEADLDESFDPVVSGECTGLTYQGTSSMLTTTTGLKHYFAIDGDASDYTFKVNGKELQLQSDKNGTYVHVDNIKAKDLSKPAALTVTNKDGSTFTLKYSVYTNVKQVVASENFTTAAKNMMKALYGYGEAAMAYFATRN